MEHGTKCILGDQQAYVGTWNLPDLGNVAIPVGTNDADPHVKKKSNTDNKLNDKNDPQPKANTNQWFCVEKLVKTKKLNDGKRYFLVKWARRKNQKQFKDTRKPEENISEYAIERFYVDRAQQNNRRNYVSRRY